MPELEKYPVPLYDPAQPYHYQYDNLPLQNLILRDEVINDQVDYNSTILMDAAGNQGTLSNRLNQSLNPDGSLTAAAVDATLHNIADHTDGSASLSDDQLAVYTSLGYEVVNPAPFVRMLKAERDKLALIASEATNMTIGVQTPSNVVLFTQGAVNLIPSDTITWDIINGHDVQANMAFPEAAAHRHYYDLTPLTTDFVNFQVTSVNTPYVAGSLRVYINGVRLSATANVYEPASVLSSPWRLNSFTPHETEGTFVLENSITADDVIRIDFDVALA